MSVYRIMWGVLLFFCGNAYADGKGEIYWNAGVENAAFSWSIAGNVDGTSPNVLSEISWDKLKIYKGDLGVKYRLYQGERYKLFVDASIVSGKVADGQGRDSDYIGDYRTNEYSRSYSDASGGRAKGGEVLFGLMGISAGHYTVIPKVGFRKDELELLLRDGYQVLPVKTSFTGLNSSYRAGWDGLSFGFDLSLPVNAEFHLNMELISYFKLRYSATADWNLRDDFKHPVSYTHNAEGHGHKLGVGINYILSKYFVLGIALDRKVYEVNSGVDTLYLADGNVVKTQFNGAEWYSDSFKVGVSFNF